MNRTFRTAVLGASTVALVSTMAACGAGSDVAGSDVACPVDPPQESTTVDVLAYSSPAMDPFTDAMANGCSKVENLNVEHSPVDFSAQLEKAQLSLSQDEGTYDIVEVYSGTLPQYAGQGWLHPLDSFYKEHSKRYGLDDIDPQLLDYARYQGKLYALPMQVNVHVMAYRKDILGKLGISPPKTFTELIEAARKIEESGEVDDPLALSYSAESDITTSFNNSLTSLGGDWVDPKTDEVLLTSPKAVAAMTSLKQLMPFLPSDTMSADQVAVTTQMQNGDAAITVLYSGSMASLSDPSLTKYAEDIAFAAPPSVESGGGPWATLNMDGFSIAKNSPVDEEVLAEVAAVGSGPDAAKAAGELAFPVRESVRSDPDLSAKAPFWSAGQAAIDAGAHPYPAKPYFVPLQEAVRPFIADGVSGRMPVAEALARAQQEAETIVDQYR